MSCPAITNKGGKLSISRFPVACELTLSELALLDYAVVPGVGSIGDTGIEQEISSYSTVNAGISPQSKAAAVGKAWDVEMIESQSAARDVFETASAVGNKDTYATRIEWPDGAVEFSIVQVSSPTYVKGAPSGVRIVRYTMIPSFIPIVTNSLPVASNVVVTGSGFVGSTLVATYDYYSPLGLPESGTEYQWYADVVAIPGETSTTLLLTSDHLGAHITFGVTPSDGLSYGHEAISVSVGPVADSARFTADSGLYTDTALTVPVTSYGDAVAGWRGAGLIGVQPTLTARPVYGRMPVSGVRNLLARSGTPSDDFSDAAWTISNGSISSAGDTISYEGSSIPAQRFTLYGGLSQHHITRSAVWLSGESEGVYSWLVDVSGLNNHTVAIRSLNSGSRAEFEWVGPQSINATLNSGANLGYTIVGDYQALIWCSFQGPTSSTANIQIYVGLFGSYDGDGEYITVARCQPEFATEPTAYQKVTAAYDVTESGVPDVPILYYDLGDDVLPAAMTLPAITSGTLVIAGEEGIWIEDSFNHAGGSWSLGPTTYTGGPAGLLPNLIGNRVLGFAVFANSLTPEQRQVEVAYWMGRGAPGVWEAGSNVFVPPITLGTGWTDNMDDTYTHVGPTAGFIQGQGTSAPGDIWMFSYTVSGSTIGYVQPGGVGATGPAFTGNGAARALVVAAGAGGTPRFQGTASFDGTLSGAEINLITINTDPYP